MFTFIYLFNLILSILLMSAGFYIRSYLAPDLFSFCVIRTTEGEREPCLRFCPTQFAVPSPWQPAPELPGRGSIHLEKTQSISQEAELPRCGSSQTKQKNSWNGDKRRPFEVSLLLLKSHPPEKRKLTFFYFYFNLFEPWDLPSAMFIFSLFEFSSHLRSRFIFNFAGCAECSYCFRPCKHI